MGIEKEKFTSMMTRFIRHFFAALIFFILLGVCAIPYAFSQTSSSTLSTESFMMIKGFKAVATLEGQPQYTLEADSAVLSEKENNVELENIHLAFYKKGEKTASGSLTARKGNYYFRDTSDGKHTNNDIDLRGNVVFETTDGTRLKSPEVHYNAKTEKIYSNAGFEKYNESKDQTIVVTGKSFVTDKNMEHWEDTGATLSFRSHSSPDSKEK